MAQTKLIGSSNQGSIAPAEMAIDPMFLAARVALRPLDYSGAGRVLGHYRAAGFTAAGLFTAGVNLANLRFADNASFCVPLRIRASLAVAAIVTGQRLDPLGLFVARGYSAQETTNLTALVLTGSNAKMRTAPMGTTNVTLGVANAAAGLTGGTRAIDSNPIGIAGLSGAAAIAGLGTGLPITELYSAVAAGGHPLVLGVNEGLLLQWGATALATGTVVVGWEVEWAEVVVF